MFKELLFEKCKLKGTEFVKTKLKDLDLSDSTKDALNIALTNALNQTGLSLLKEQTYRKL